MVSFGISYKTGDLIAVGKLSIGDGYRAKNSELTNSGLPFARAGNIDNGFHFRDADRYPEEDLSKVGEKVSQPGDVVFTSKGTVGRFAFVTQSVPRFVFSPQLSYWRSLDSDLIEPRFLFYWMHGQEFWLQAAGLKGQTDMADYVSLADQRRMRITLPVLPEQRAISRILGALDDKIELNREMNRTLEATAQAIFRSWFVDFDPVVARAEGGKPFGMSDDLAALFPDRFVESELGPIPEGWEVLSLGEAGNWLSGGTPSKKNPDYWGGEFPWISAKSIEFLCRWSEDRITETALEAGAKIAPKGSVLFVVRGMSLASEFRFGLATRELSFNQDLKAIVPTGRVDPALTLLYLASSCPTILDLVDEASHGTKRLETQLLQDLQMVVPKPEIQKQLAPTLWALIDQMLCNEEENETLAKLRDLLLPKLLSGEIRVGEAQEVAAAAGA